MKRKIMALAIAAVALFSVSASAQHHGRDCDNNCVKKEKCDNKCDRKCDRKCPVNKCTEKKCAGMMAMFSDLNLSDDQVTRLQAIPTPRQVMKEAAKSGAAKGVEGKQYFRTVRENYLKQVKEVLNDNQYEKFLENFFVNYCPNHDKNKGVKQGKGNRYHHGTKGGNKNK